MSKEKRQRMEGAPDWYDTPLDELDFEWSPEEKLEIERYCEKILKNIADEGGMTPMERWKATMEGKEKDRMLVDVIYANTYATRTLDSAADAVKPIDVYRYPKLWVKAHLATTARFALDYPNTYGTSYSEGLWGGKSKMIEYGTPILDGDAPIQTLEDLEGLDVPDPMMDGLYPGYLWGCREMRRIFDEYGLSKVMPLWIRICAGPIGTVMMVMMGYNNFLMKLRKDPELCRRCLELATEWEIRYGQAVIDESRVDALYMCAMTGAVPPKGNEWIADYWAKVGKTLGPQVPVSYGYAFAMTLQWLPIMYERGALGPGSFCGGVMDPSADFKKAVDFHREHNLWIGCITQERTLLNGPVSAIEEEIKERCDYGRSHLGFSIALGAVDYWTPQSNLEAAVAAAKKLGRYE